MPNESTPEVQQQSNSLISIERVVAFVLGPIIVAFSGWLSAEAARIGVKVSAAEIKYAFATGGLTAGALVWKWLHGRQKTPLLLQDGRHVLNTVTNTLEDLGISGTQDQHIQATVMNALEHHAQSIAQELAQHISATVRTPAPAAPEAEPIPAAGKGEPVVAETPASEPPIPPAEFDPAPSTPPEVVPPTASVPLPDPQQAPPTPPAGVGG